MNITLLDRYRGSLLGLACGDAVGTTVEFMPRGTFLPVTDMVGGGPFSLRPGQWTDDTSMALCLAESLLRKGGFDAADQMGRYLNWWKWGYLSSTGECFDIGMTVREALASFESNGDAFAGSTDPYSAGNGSMMRLAPVVLFYFPDAEKIRQFSALSSRTTHAAQEAIECCQLLAEAIRNALRGVAKDEVLRLADAGLSAPKVREIARGNYREKAKTDIVGSGYAVASLEAAFWCFDTTSSFAEAVLAAANLGDDADTTAAIVGQLAGAYYGVHAIPIGWLDTLYLRDDIEETADGLFAAASKQSS
ncbi:ADP-ribosylglycohydrolase family protein [Pseudomonas sp. MUP55]|uniref:ADP-ribosylglycohydrolase family protein n=1 Tax=Pseudomonas sp. MUP55 TaxID=3087234 RepID=UPI002A59CEF7|nr:MULTISPECIES: ADP-ribosylglycohydrolase family protein [unclassified Pseudomonas]WPN95173.1 ADP-ribosylglycohydrolase family protein [Pseudomonas sp. MUP56]WPO00702.1 ADP-ribosylglycohydrolase family protein [Pseudomonas sp. MUP55]